MTMVMVVMMMCQVKRVNGSLNNHHSKDHESVTTFICDHLYHNNHCPMIIYDSPHQPQHRHLSGFAGGPHFGQAVSNALMQIFGDTVPVMVDYLKCSDICRALCITHDAHYADFALLVMSGKHLQCTGKNRRFNIAFKMIHNAILKYIHR